MNTPIKMAAVLGIVGVVALVAVAGAAVATGSMPGLSGTNAGGHMNGMMGSGDANCMMDGSCQTDACTGAQCQGNASCANGQGCEQQCQSAEMQAQMAQHGCGAGDRSCN